MNPPMDKNAIKWNPQFLQLIFQTCQLFKPTYRSFPALSIIPRLKLQAATCSKQFVLPSVKKARRNLPYIFQTSWYFKPIFIALDCLKKQNSTVHHIFDWQFSAVFHFNWEPIKLQELCKAESSSSNLQTACTFPNGHIWACISCNGFSN